MTKDQTPLPELLPCPFCKSKNIRVNCNGDMREVYVECISCRATGPRHPIDSYAPHDIDLGELLVSRDWNARAPDPRILALLESEEMVRSVAKALLDQWLEDDRTNNGENMAKAALAHVAEQIKALSKEGV